MQFDINEEYRVTTDRFNVILQKKHLSKPSSKDPVGGKEVWDETYYGSFEALMRNLGEQCIKDSLSLSQLAENRVLWASLMDSIPAKVFAAVDAEKREYKKSLWHKKFVDEAKARLDPAVFDEIKRFAKDGEDV